MVKAVRFRPALRRDQALVVELVVCRPDESDAVAARVAARPALTFRFSGVAYAKLALIPRESCAVRGHCRWPVAGGVAVTIAVRPHKPAAGTTGSRVVLR